MSAFPYPAAETSPAIRILTLSIFLFTAGLLTAAMVVDAALLYPVAILALVLLFSWLKSPVAYDWQGDDLVVHFRWGSKQRGPVEHCGPMGKKLKGVWRLFGNGGLFCMSGQFWSKDLGKFHAYVSNYSLEKVLVVDRFGARTLISPEDPAAFLKARPGA